MTMMRLSNFLACCGALLAMAACSEAPVERSQAPTDTPASPAPELPEDPAATSIPVSAPAESPAGDQPDRVTDPTPLDETPSNRGPTVLTSADGAYIVAYTIDPDPIPLNELFDLHVEVMDAHGEPIDTAKLSLEVDARMPQHRHGMNTVPDVSLNDDGTFTVTEMLFHMSGFWELYFDITRGAVTERAQSEIDIQR